MDTLDTNAIIYYLRSDARAVPLLRDIFLRDVSIYVSTITEVELFSFSKLTQKEIAEIEALLQTVAVIALDSRIARIAGSLRGAARLATADSVIAATALFTNTELVTRNVSDFRNIPNLKLLQI